MQATDYVIEDKLTEIERLLEEEEEKKEGQLPCVCHICIARKHFPNDI